MRICYVLLSSTFGLHQYTADLANRMAQANYEVHLVTSSHYPRDRYLPAVIPHTPVTRPNSSFLSQVLKMPAFRKVQMAIQEMKPDVVHLTGPHLWNVPLLWWLQQVRLPAVHTLHDLDPGNGASYGRLLPGWNGLVIRLADHILVHSYGYLNRLLAQGLPAGRVTHVPLLHLFLGQTWLEAVEHMTNLVRYEPWALFFGRLEHYKGVDHLVTACAMLDRQHLPAEGPRLILAGPGSLADRWAGALPPHVEVRDRMIGDEEALELFCRCSLLVLPYLNATQSALIPAAYFFRKPVIVTRTGSLPEYVEAGETGWVVEPDHPPSLARCLQGALADPERLAMMGQAGRAWYDRQRVSEQRVLERMYTRLVEERKERQLRIWQTEGLPD